MNDLEKQKLQLQMQIDNINEEIQKRNNADTEEDKEAYDLLNGMIQEMVYIIIDSTNCKYKGQKATILMEIITSIVFVRGEFKLPLASMKCREVKVDKYFAKTFPSLWKHVKKYRKETISMYREFYQWDDDENEDTDTEELYN